MNINNQTRFNPNGYYQIKKKPNHINIRCSRLNSEDYSYFQKNFKVKMSNVSSLEEADIILLGEKHTCLEHRIKICWLINKLAQDGDFLKIEGAGPEELTPEIFEATYHYPLYPKLKITGWDCIEALKRTSDFFEQSAEFNGWLEYLLETQDSMTDEDKVKAIQEMNTFFSIDDIVNELNEMIENNFDFDYDDNFENDARRIFNLPEMLRDLNKISLLSENATGKELDAVFLATSALTNECFYLWGMPQLLGMNFLNRNLSLAGTFSQDGVLYEIAGQLHLQKKELLGVKKSFEKIESALKNKKYVILFPTKSRENLEHVETQYVQVALASPHPKQICTSIAQNAQKNRELKEQIKKKLDAIPHEIMEKTFSSLR